MNEASGPISSRSLSVSWVLEVALHAEAVVAGTVLIAEAIHRHSHVSRDRVYREITTCSVMVFL